MLKGKCPYCDSDNYNHHTDYKTLNNGKRSLYLCGACGKVFSETKGHRCSGFFLRYAFNTSCILAAEDFLFR